MDVGETAGLDLSKIEKYTHSISTKAIRCTRTYVTTVFPSEF